MESLILIYSLERRDLSMAHYFFFFFWVKVSFFNYKKEILKKHISE